MNNDASYLLKEKGLRVTPARVGVLSLFLNSTKAYSLTDVEGFLKKDFDRSTLFRTLQSLNQEHLLEKFINSSGTAVFMMHSVLENYNENSHLHFKCGDCESVSTLPDLPDNYLAALGNKTVKSLNLLLEGTCEECQNKK
jgi:Fur family ferric uptake transcriptional regulator